MTEEQMTGEQAPYTIVPMTMEFARQIVAWRYPPPYNLYNHLAGTDEVL